MSFTFQIGPQSNQVGVEFWKQRFKENDEMKLNGKPFAFFMNELEATMIQEIKEEKVHLRLPQIEFLNGLNVDTESISKIEFKGLEDRLASSLEKSDKLTCFNIITDYKEYFEFNSKLFEFLQDEFKVNKIGFAVGEGISVYEFSKMFETDFFVPIQRTDQAGHALGDIFYESQIECLGKCAGLFYRSMDYSGFGGMHTLREYNESKLVSIHLDLEIPKFSQLTLSRDEYEEWKENLLNNLDSNFI